MSRTFHERQLDAAQTEFQRWILRSQLEIAKKQERQQRDARKDGDR